MGLLVGEDVGSNETVGVDVGEKPFGSALGLNVGFSDGK